MSVTNLRASRNPNPMPLFDWADRQPRRTLPPLPIYGDQTLTMARTYRIAPRIAAVIAEALEARQ